MYTSASFPFYVIGPVRGELGHGQAEMNKEMADLRRRGERKRKKNGNRI